MATSFDFQRNLHLGLLGDKAASSQDDQELTGTPIFTADVLKHSGHSIAQYGFLAGQSDLLDTNCDTNQAIASPDPRVFFNISAPSSAFICGSQGSGKSHTLSCLLENCLMSSYVSVLDTPLAGLVFHYDSFSSDQIGTPCEAAHLSSNPNISVRVLCSPTNFQTIKRTYAGLNVQIKPLMIDQSHLNTKRMLDLMAVNQDDGRMPLYLHSINRVLREMRLVQQQQEGSTFNYAQFKRLVEDCDMTPMQLAPLKQRLDTLESFMPQSQTSILAAAGKVQSGKVAGSDWTIEPGMLTIVDLSCPCVTSEGACALFNMCLGLFLEQKTKVGRVIALDEAHKYMSAASEATSLTNTLLSSIRLQRHLGTRIFISTQEPTISPKLLDLCSITIVHRFTSPEWLRCLKLHLAALDNDRDEETQDKRNPRAKSNDVFNQIVKLRVGEALLFSPSAIVGIENRTGLLGATDSSVRTIKLGTGYIKIKVRGRITSDGGKSILALNSGPRKIPSSNVLKFDSTIYPVPKQRPAQNSTAASQRLTLETSANPFLFKLSTVSTSPNPVLFKSSASQAPKAAPTAALNTKKPEAAMVSYPSNHGSNNTIDKTSVPRHKISAATGVDEVDSALRDSTAKLTSTQNKTFTPQKTTQATPASTSKHVVTALPVRKSAAKFPQTNATAKHSATQAAPEFSSSSSCSGEETVSEESSSEEEAEICRFLAKKKGCKWGDKCKFYHPPKESTA